jgi:hypothetical protein
VGFKQSKNAKSVTVLKRILKKAKILETKICEKSVKKAEFDDFVTLYCHSVTVLKAVFASICPGRAQFVTLFCNFTPKLF